MTGKLNDVWNTVIYFPYRMWNRYYYALKYAWQRAYRGFDDCAKWNLNDEIAEIAIPCLKYMIKDGCGHPLEFKERWEWEAILKRMVKGFEAHQKIVGDLGGLEKNFSKWDKEQDEGLKLFAKHFGSLWD